MCFLHLATHVLVGPVSSVGLRVDLQDMVEVIALGWWLHVTIQNSGRTNFLAIEPVATTQTMTNNKKVEVQIFGWMIGWRLSIDNERKLEKKRK